MTQNYPFISYRVEKNLNTSIRFLRHYSAALVYVQIAGEKRPLFLN